MKKVLALVLALAMILGCFSFVSAAEFTDVAADADFHDAAAVLSDLGVASGYTDGTFKPEKVVTRAEMAAFIIKALGIAPAASAVTTFSDVPATHWASGYIAYATSLGIVSGYTDGTFKPDQTVSYDQAITMLIQALGYTADSLTGTYPAAYVSKAKTLGILDGVDALGTAGANRGDVAQLLYNTLNQLIGHVDKDGAWTKAYPDDTMMGRLGATKAAAQVITENDVKNAKIDIASYLGAYVVPYKSGSKIVGIYSVESEFVEDKLTEGTSGAANKIGSYKIAFAEDQPSITYFVNGESATMTKSYFESHITSYAGVEYKFAAELDGNYVKKIFSAQIWTGSTTFSMTDALVKQLKDKDTLNGKAFEMTSSDEIDEKSFILEGVDSLADIKSDNVVTVYVKPEAKTVSKVVVGTEVVTGKISKRATDGKSAVIDGTTYKVAGSFLFADKHFDDEYQFFLNADGKVFAEEIVEGTTSSAYAVLIAYTQGDTSWTDATAVRQIKVVTTAGETVTYTLAKNCYDTKDGSTKWATGTGFTPAKDNVYKIVLDEDGVVERFYEVTLEGVANNEKVDGYYLLGKRFASDATLFVQDSDNEWSVLAVAKADGLVTKNTKVLVVDGKIALLTTTETDADTDAVYGVFTGYEKTGASKGEVSFMVDGKVETYKTEKDEAFFTTSVYGKVEFTGEKVTAYTEESDKTAALNVTSKAAVKDYTVTCDSEATTPSYITLAEDVVVFAIDDEGEVTMSTIDAIVGQDDNEYTVTFYDTDSTADGVYDVAVIIEK